MMVQNGEPIFLWTFIRKTINLSLVSWFANFGYAESVRTNSSKMASQTAIHNKGGTNLRVFFLWATILEKRLRFVVNSMFYYQNY